MFLNNLPLIFKDSREEFIRENYNEAFVRWFIRVNEENDFKMNIHFIKYKEFMSDYIKRG